MQQITPYNEEKRGLFMSHDISHEETGGSSLTGRGSVKWGRPSGVPLGQGKYGHYIPK